MTTTATPTPPTPNADCLSTAQLLARHASPIDVLLTASVGIAVHHLSDHLTDATPIDRHRATTVLTKQIRPLLDDRDAFAMIEALVTDPERRALPDDRSAAELCGHEWPDVVAAAGSRARLARIGADDFGTDAIINLAFVRALGSHQPWWGLDNWIRQVDAWFDPSAFGSRLRLRLLTEPENAAPDILWNVLSS